MDQPFKPKPILNRSELRQIKKARTRFEGKKIITDDVKKLKSLKVVPDIADSEKVNYYKEPIWIEYYIPKESRFALETKYMLVKLIDVTPRENVEDIIIRQALNENSFIDVLTVLDTNLGFFDLVHNSYQNFFEMLQRISINFKEYEKTGEIENLKVPVYLTETLMQYEPTLASLELLGDFTTHNLNWLTRKLNEGNIPFSLEDRTIAILIKRRNEFWESNDLPPDEDFDLLSALFFEQAYPNR
ncbi:MAG: hypothetical protein K8R21_01160, partial [Leptospira sp.]|nr:hypothetical protein [Leptospira sp.]